MIKSNLSRRAFLGGSALDSTAILCTVTGITPADLRDRGIKEV